ncbi:MAG: regulator of chromosome condensation [Labilithrix sp.]|nr:regulator of chromosome condensation [Labilithrix sp.]
MKAGSLLSFLTIGALAGGILIACSDTEERPTFGGPPEVDATTDGADETPDVDGGASDSGPSDARPPFDAAPPAVTCSVTPCMTALVAGPRHYCATSNDGVIRCWGDPAPLGGFVNTEDPNPGATPVALTGLSNVVDMGASDWSTYVALADGSVSYFGSDSPTPTPVAEVSNAKKLAITSSRKCAVKTNGEVFCWGDSYQLGSGAVVMDLAGEQGVDVVIDQAVGLAIGSKGTLFSWGDRALLGRDTSFPSDLTPGAVRGVPKILQVVTSNRDTLALAEDGRLFAWGGNGNGALGIGAFRGSATPVEVRFTTAAWPTQISIAPTHSCARMSDSSLTCWGSRNTWGHLGYAELPGVYAPKTVSGLARGVVAVAVSFFSTCVLTTEGSIQCWGDNSYGQLGLGTRDTDRHPSPTTVLFQ